MAIPTLHEDFSGTVELYSTFINQMKAENPGKAVEIIIMESEVPLGFTTSTQAPPITRLMTVL
jgi:hypothetical protein